MPAAQKSNKAGAKAIASPPNHTARPEVHRYPQKIAAAIVALNEGKTGSRLCDIKKYIKKTYTPNLDGQKFDSMLQGQVARMVNEGRLILGTEKAPRSYGDLRYRLPSDPSTSTAAQTSSPEASGERMSTVRGKGSVKNTARSPKNPTVSSPLTDAAMAKNNTPTSSNPNTAKKYQGNKAKPCIRIAKPSPASLVIKALYTPKAIK